MEKITFDFKDRVSLVTGGAQGFGLDIAKRFLKSGAKVIIWDIDSKMLEKAIKEIDNPNLSSNIVDVSNYKEVDSCVKEIAKKTNIDILINNAGITNDNLLIRMDDSQWFDTIETNINSLYKISKIFVKPMIKKRNGRIICISSVVASTGNAGQTNYVTSKSGMIGFCKSLAKEVATRGITVNCVSPGFIETDMTDKLNDSQKEQISRNIPINKMGTPEDIAYAVSFLASDKASYITGETINVNGGLFMP